MLYDTNDTVLNSLEALGVRLVQAGLQVFLNGSYARRTLDSRCSVADSSSDRNLRLLCLQKLVSELESLPPQRCS